MHKKPNSIALKRMARNIYSKAYLTHYVYKKLQVDKEEWNRLEGLVST